MRSLSAKNISCQGWTEKKGLAKLVADEKALGPLLEFSNGLTPNDLRYILALQIASLEP